MTAAAEGLIAHGRTLLARERAYLLAGQISEVVALADEKQAYVARLERELVGVPGTPSMRSALARLVTQARENERLLAAARQGVRLARRHLQAMAATAQGALAYDRDGSAIVSQEQSRRRSSRA